MGPTARVYTFPAVSDTDATAVCVSFQPTATRFKLPAVCTALNVTEALVTADDCGTVELTCTNVGVEGCGGAARVVALAMLEYPLTLPAASAARTR